MLARPGWSIASWQLNISLIAVAEGVFYGATLTAFFFVLYASARFRHETLILACIPPVFVSVVLGFFMGISAWFTISPAVVVAAAALPWSMAKNLAGRYTARDLLIAIYLAWFIGLALAPVAFSFPDPVPV
jgi:hypothetical protein